MKITSILVLHESQRSEIDMIAGKLTDSGYEVEINPGRDDKKRPAWVLISTAPVPKLRAARLVDPQQGVNGVKAIFASILTPPCVVAE